MIIYSPKAKHPSIFLKNTYKSQEKKEELMVEPEACVFEEEVKEEIHEKLSVMRMNTLTENIKTSFYQIMNSFFDNDLRSQAEIAENKKSIS